MPTTVFLSYANIKNIDDTVSAFHAALDRAIKGRFNMDAKVFIDKRDIRAGDRWENNLSTELASANVLLVLLSPVWLSRDWCRKEYEYFKEAHAGETNKGVVIPILWVDTEEHDAKDENSKALLSELKEIQMVDWRDLQYDRNYESSTELRRAIGKLADDIKSKLLQASAAVPAGT